MASFRTEFSTRLHKTRIGLESKILTLGSCFSDSIGNTLKGNKINTLVNPFGTAYNPVSIQKLMQMAIRNEKPSDDTYLLRDEIHSNYDFHSSFSDLTKGKLEKRMVGQINTVHTYLHTCDFLFITWGTAWVYERKDNRQIVSNCHKQPSVLFSKRLLTHKEIINSFIALHHDLKQFNPGIKIILTLSPVRHLKDTMELNNVSKSVLRLACHSITQRVEETDYFPAYEIMMDDLRDYRFYAADRIHPSVEAEEYIWEKLTDRYFDSDTKSIIQQWELVKKLLAHKPFHAQSASHQKFLNETLLKLKALSTKINVEDEILLLSQEIGKTENRKEN